MLFAPTHDHPGVVVNHWPVGILSLLQNTHGSPFRHSTQPVKDQTIKIFISHIGAALGNNMMQTHSDALRHGSRKRPSAKVFHGHWGYWGSLEWSRAVGSTLKLPCVQSSIAGPCPWTQTSRRRFVSYALVRPQLPLSRIWTWDCNSRARETCALA